MLPAGLVGLGVIAVAVALGALGGGDDGTPSQRPYRGSEPPVRFELPAFELASYRGGRVSSDELRGRVVLLTLLDSQCTEACPILASVIAGAVDRLTSEERAQMRALAVTVDPAEDTPASVRRFLQARRAEGRLDYLLGSERELRPLWDALQVLPSLDTGRDSLHSAPLRIYSREGIWVTTLHAGADLSEENLLHDIRVVLRALPDDEVTG
ncbi:MAG: SCO family protein [Gaiellaceae bacterium]